MFNPYNTTIKSVIRLNNGYTGPEKIKSPVERVISEFELPNDKGHKWAKVQEVTLEEIPTNDLKIDHDGWVNFGIGHKEILTIEFI